MESFKLAENIYSFIQGVSQLMTQKVFPGLVFFNSQMLHRFPHQKSFQKRSAHSQGLKSKFELILMECYSTLSYLRKALY